MDRPSKDPSARHIRQHIKAYYERLFNGHSAPSPELPIRQGRDLAAALLYPLDSLAVLPARIWEHFLPCGNPLQYLHPKAGDSILNLGSGIGIDSMALAQTCEYPIDIVNLDVVSQILFESRTVTSELGLSGLDPSHSSISFICGEGSHLPFRPATFDWILLNGVLNLFPDKQSLLTEIWQVLKEGGRLVVMDLCAATELPEYFEKELDGWAWCMSGAHTKSQLVEMVESAGFRVEVLSENEDPDLLFRMGLLARKAS